MELRWTFHKYTLVLFTPDPHSSKDTNVAMSDNVHPIALTNLINHEKAYTKEKKKKEYNHPTRQSKETRTSTQTYYTQIIMKQNSTFPPFLSRPSLFCNLVDNNEYIHWEKEKQKKEVGGKMRKSLTKKRKETR